MQTQFTFSINNVVVPPPDNWQALEGDLSFESGSPSAVLNQQKLVWKGANAALINAAKASGLNNGLGIFEGPTLVISVCDNPSDIFFNGCIDMTDPETQWSCDIITTKIRNVNIETIEELFSSISFSYLATNSTNGGPTTGPYNGAWINPAPVSFGGDYLEILYQNNNIPDFVEFFTMVLSIYNMVQEAVKIVKDIVGIITGIAGAATALGIGAVILGVLELVAAIAGMILTCIALVDLFQMAIDYLISPIMTKLGMNAVTMITRACQYFGIQFNSSIFGVVNNVVKTPTYYTNLAIMPSKRAWSENESVTRSVTMGFLSTYQTNQRMQYDEVYNWSHGGFAYGYYDGTITDLLNALSDMFNAKAKVILNASGQPCLYLERWDYFYNQANYKLPNISQQAPFQNPYKTNANDIAANYMVQWSTDSSDFNTLNDFGGNNCYYTVQPKVVGNQSNVTLKNLKQVNIQFAHAIRKEQLTAVESILSEVWTDLTNLIFTLSPRLKKILTTINKFAPLPGISALLSNPFTATLGVMYLYNNVTSTPKAMILTGGALGNTSAGRSSVFNALFSFTQPAIVTGYLIDPNSKGDVNNSLPCLAGKSLMKYFHYSNLVSAVYPPAYAFAGPGASSKAGQPYYNQWEIYDDNDIHLCCSDYNLIYNNNIIQDYFGNFGRVISLKWNVFKGMAKITYWINNPYTYNLVPSYVTDGIITSQTI